MKSAKSIAFLRPIWKALRRGKLVVVLRRFSRLAGHRDWFIISEFPQLRELIADSPPQTILQWVDINEPDWETMAKGKVPNNKGVLECGSY